MVWAGIVGVSLVCGFGLEVGFGQGVWVFTESMGVGWECECRRGVWVWAGIAVVGRECWWERRVEWADCVGVGVGGECGCG